MYVYCNDLFITAASSTSAPTMAVMSSQGVADMNQCGFASWLYTSVNTTAYNEFIALNVLCEAYISFTCSGNRKSVTCDVYPQTTTISVIRSPFVVDQ